MDYFINGFSVTDSGPNGGGIGGCLLIVALVFFGFMWLLSAILPYVIMGIIILIAVILTLLLLAKMLPIWKRIILMVVKDVSHVSKWLYARYWSPTEEVE